MKCAECGAETAEAASLCVVCGALTGRQPSVPADGAPGGSVGTVLAPATSAAPPAVRTRGKRLRVAGAIARCFAFGHETPTQRQILVHVEAAKTPIRPGWA